jgi:hypothetical protein
MDDARLLALASSLEIHGFREQSQEIDLYFLETAADHVWTTTGGDPCWSKLEIDAYFERHAQMPGWTHGAKDNGVATLLGFFTFLGRRGVLPLEKTRPVLLALDAHVSDAMRELGYVPLRERERRLLN